MNAAEYWLLDSVITLPMPLHLLHPDRPGLIEAFCSHHGLTYDQLVATLMTLLQEECLYLYVPSSYGLGNPSIPATKASVEQILSGEPWSPVHYGVTATGGARWEAVSGPDWGRYTMIGGAGDARSWWIEGRDRPLLEEWLRVYPIARGTHGLVAESVRWQTQQPWWATYWKCLPVGYRVYFREMESTFQPSPAWAVQRLHDLSIWYTNPYAAPAT